MIVKKQGYTKDEFDRMKERHESLLAYSNELADYLEGWIESMSFEPKGGRGLIKRYRAFILKEEL